MIAVYTPTPVVIQGDLARSGSHIDRPSRDGPSRLARRCIEDSVAKIDRSSGRDHEKLVSLLISHEMALRSAEKSDQHGDPARAKTDRDRGGRNSEMIGAARAAPAELARRARLEEDLAAAKRYLGEEAADPSGPSAAVPEPNALDRIRIIGRPTALMGMVPGIADPSKGPSMTFGSRPWEAGGHSAPGRAIVATMLLLAIVLLTTSRFRGFWINLVALLTALLLAGYTGGPLVLAGGLGLAVAGWKKGAGLNSICGSADELFDRLAAVDDLDRPAARGRVLGREVDPHGLGHGGDQVHHADGTVDDVDAVFVGRADDLAVFHAAAADDDRPASRPVIAARVLIDPRRAAELTHPDDRGGIEQPAVGQVGDQGRHALVELGEKPLRERVEIVGVGVPAIERDLDVGDALVRPAAGPSSNPSRMSRGRTRRGRRPARGRG